MSYGKLVKIDREFTVTICDNGFLLAVNGRTENDDWSNTKVICNDLTELHDQIIQLATEPLND